MQSYLSEMIKRKFLFQSLKEHWFFIAYAIFNTGGWFLSKGFIIFVEMFLKVHKSFKGFTTKEPLVFEIGDRDGNYYRILFSPPKTFNLKVTKNCVEVHQAKEWLCVISVYLTLSYRKIIYFFLSFKASVTIICIKNQTGLWNVASLSTTV